MILFMFPQRRVFATDFARPLFALRAFDDRLDIRFVPAQVGLHSVEQAAGQRGALRRDALHQAFKRIGESFDAIVLQFPADLFEIDADLGQRCERPLRFVQVLFDCQTDLAVIAEGGECRGRKRVDGVRADQVFDVEHVAVVRILRAGARPERALNASALRFQFREAFARKDLFEPLVLHLRVRNRGFAEKAGESGLFVFVLRPADAEFELAINGGIDAADEDAGDRRHVVNRLSCGGALFQSSDVRLGDFFVIFYRKDHRDVDIDSGGDAFADGGNAFGRGGNLDHHVRAVERGPQALGFGDCGFSVARQQRRDFQADVTVEFFGARVDWFEEIGGALNVFDDQGFVNLVDALALGDQTAHRLVVIGAPRDGLLEDRRVRGHAAQIVAAYLLAERRSHTRRQRADLLRQIAGVDQRATDVVIPNTLSQFFYFY